MQLEDLVDEGLTPPFTHDLVYLCRVCSEVANFDICDIDLCARLNPYAVEHRYPVQSTLQESDVLLDLDRTEGFHKMIMTRIRPDR
jgi:hypothetical protein